MAATTAKQKRWKTAVSRPQFPTPIQQHSIPASQQATHPSIRTRVLLHRKEIESYIGIYIVFYILCT